MKLINIITRCTRPQHLYKVESSILIATTKLIDFKWIILVDTSSVYSLDSNFLSYFSKYDLRFLKGKKGDMGHSLINSVIDELENEEWFYILDDDNQIHPDLIKEFKKALRYDTFKGFIFSQYVGGKDFSGVEIREAIEENVKVQKIDMAQFLLQKSLVGEKRLLPMKYQADGIFIEELFKEKKEDFYLLNKVLSYYNSLKEDKNLSLPRIMVLGTESELKTIKRSVNEEDKLCSFYPQSEEVINVLKSDPDSIVTVGENYNIFPELTSLSLDFRKRWVHLETPNNIGEVAYNCAMNYALSNVLSEVVSVFTPIYNTGNKILRTYESLARQTFTNWEWVIINDSDNLETLKIVEKIPDPRIKIFDLKEKSKGNIGEVKYRACSLSKGKYLVELDHDDYLLPHALQEVVRSFETFSDAGFVYSDCVEVDNNLNSLTYGETFAFGYGSYREEEHLGRKFKVANTPNINPVTIRHIVSSPNHLRAWRRDVYFNIGGHNRRLTIADDYELVVRSFLNTQIVKIEKACYLQFHHGENTQNSTKGDIQRRVRSISDFYNSQIKNRFEELGKEDWAYGKNLLSLSKRNIKEENYVNYIL